MNQPQISSSVSQATGEAREWFEHNRRRFRYHLPERTDRTYEQVYDEALNEIETRLHLYALSEAFEANARPETEDHTANPLLHHAPERPPAPSTQSMR